jgi:sugar lactone lactonase YvrE
MVCHCRVDVKAGDWEELVSPVGLPNGMAWDTRRHIMYFVDTSASTITAYPTDEAGMPKRDREGGLSGTAVVRVPKDEGIPDGLTIDRWDSKSC